MVSLRQDRERLERGQKLTHELDPLLANSRDRNQLPVKFRPGRDRLCAIPSATGSPLTAKRTGLSVVARIARIAGPLDTMRSAGVARSSGSMARRAVGSPGA